MAGTYTRIYTERPSTLPQWYLDEVEQRINNREADLTDYQYREEIEKRKGLSDKKNRERWKNASYDELHKNLGLYPKNHMSSSQAHHLIPLGLVETESVIQEAIRLGFDYNSGGNGVYIGKYLHLGPEFEGHYVYSNHIRSFIRGNYDASKYQNELDFVVNVVLPYARGIISEAKRTDTTISDVVRNRESSGMNGVRYW